MAAGRACNPSCQGLYDRVIDMLDTGRKQSLKAVLDLSCVVSSRHTICQVLTAKRACKLFRSLALRHSIALICAGCWPQAELASRPARDSRDEAEGNQASVTRLSNLEADLQKAQNLHQQDATLISDLQVRAAVLSQ